MSKEYHIEALIVSLERTIEHARLAGMDIHFQSELNHLHITALHNREELKSEQPSVSS